MKKSTWISGYVKTILSNRFNHDFFVDSSRLISADAAATQIRNALLNEEPYMVGRFGAFESQAMLQADGVISGVQKTVSSSIIEHLNMNAGVFPKGEDMVLRFAEYMEQYVPDVDLLGYWQGGAGGYVTENYLTHKTVLTKLANIEPFYASFPWTDSLRGQKVLVIHPYKQSILHQYEKRNLVFPKTESGEILPEMDLSVLQAVQTIANVRDERFTDWFDALDYMYDQAMLINPKIVIIGCGAYGFPLAARLKRAGKQVIHLGGAVQLLFGIQGKRWDRNVVVQRYVNENWIRPLEQERPIGSERIENGCYW